MRVSRVSLSTRGREVDRGLLGWVACTLDDAVRLDGIALRRTLDGNLALSYPARTDAAGRRHPYARPVSDAVRRHLEEQIFSALGVEDERP